MAKYRFYFHYHKPASKIAGKPKLSIHFRDTCYLVDKIFCSVDIESKNRDGLYYNCNEPIDEHEPNQVLICALELLDSINLKEKQK